jgi:hypothetical protein
MKHINMSFCGIRYGALSLALLLACPALTLFIRHQKWKPPRRRLALTLERGAYWRTPRRVGTPINGIRLSARAMDAEGVPGADPAQPAPSFSLSYSNNFRDVPS